MTNVIFNEMREKSKRRRKNGRKKEHILKGRARCGSSKDLVPPNN
jgi:hypothetical protein